MELEKINCITKTMASELRKNGITTVEALATRSISEFKEWVDKGWILNVGLNQLKQALEEAWRLTGFWFMPGDKIEEVRGKKLVFTTGSKTVDEMLGGGIFSRELTEFAGDFGTGKTEFLFTILVEALGHNKDMTALFIDSVPSWSPMVLKGAYGVEVLTMEELWKKIPESTITTNGFEEIKPVRDYRIITCDPYKFTPIKKIIRHWYEGKMLRICTHAGLIDVTPNHSIYTSNSVDMPPVLKKATEVKVGDYVAMAPPSAYAVRSQRMIKGFFVGSTDLAWLYGLFTAEGSALRHQKNYLTTWSNKNRELLERAQAVFELNFHNKTRLYNSGGGVLRLETCGRPIYEHFKENFYTPSAEKKIPSFILNAPPRVQMEFLKGYLEGDGSHAKGYKTLFGEFSGFTTKSQVLAQQLIYLFQCICPDGSWFFNLIRKPHGEYYQINFNVANPNKRRVRPNQIVSVVPFNYKGYVYDVETEDHSFLTGIGAIKTHNTEDTFSDARVKEITNNRGYDADDIMKRIIYIPVIDSDFLTEVVDRLHITIEARNVKLILIDSLMAVLRAEYVGREVLWYRQQLLNRMIRRLLNLAKIYNIAVAGSNQVVANPQAQFVYDPIQQKVPTGGTVLGHNANTRLYLRKAKGTKRIVRLFDSNWRPEAETTVKITAKGIEDAGAEEAEESA